jgi:hypothetical protein
VPRKVSRSDSHVCFKCIGDPIVKKIVKDGGKKRLCSFCKSRRQSLTITKLAEVVDPVFREYYSKAPDEPHSSTDSDDVEYFADGESVETILESMLDPASFEIAEAVAKELEASEDFDAKGGEVAFYGILNGYEATVSDFDYSDIWKEFCESLQHETRFFNESAIDILNDLFGEIGGSYTTQSGKSLIYEIGPGRSTDNVFRARLVPNREALIKIARNPASEMGNPPAFNAMAGRMNPAGVSVFYGALEPETCTAELRMVAGEQALVGKFQVIKPLLVIDLTAFEDLYSSKRLSMFDSEFKFTVARLKFLGRLQFEISKPIRLADQEINYVPTQVVAEYLSRIRKPRIDGIVYGSAQRAGGKNIAILNHAATVERVVMPTEPDCAVTETDDEIFIIKYEEKEQTLPTPPTVQVNSSLRFQSDSIRLIEAVSVEYSVKQRNVILKELGNPIGSASNADDIL